MKLILKLFALIGAISLFYYNNQDYGDWLEAKHLCREKQEGDICSPSLCITSVELKSAKFCLRNPPEAPQEGLYCVSPEKEIDRCYFGCCDTDHGASCRSNFVKCNN